MRKIVYVPLPFDAEIVRPSATATEVIILMHGFMESGKRALAKMTPGLPEELTKHALIVAPNGPFVIPIPPAAPGDSYRAAFSWYFYDRVTQEYKINMETAVVFLEQGLKALGVENLAKRLIGFSQGGYLAPIAATGLKNVKQVIGIAAEYLSDEILKPATFRLDGIHGELDDVVLPKEGRESFEITSQSHKLAGEFKIVAGMGHKIDAAAQAALKASLRACI